MIRLLRVDPRSPTPLAAQIVTQVTWLIVCGDLPEGSRLPAIRDLAATLDINFNTVRAAYKQLEADGLVATRQGKGTTVLGYSRPRRRNTKTDTRSFSIGVIIPSHLEFYTPFLNALDAAAADPSLLFVCVTHQDPERGLSYLDQLVARAVDGIIVAGPMVPADLDTNGLPPVVFADFPGAPGPSVLFDHERASALVTRHLLDHGHRRIGFVAPPEELAPAAPKYAGHRRALTEGGTAIDPELVVTTPDYAVASGHQAGLELLTSTDAPTAIAAGSDSLAIGVLRAARELDVAVPEDLAVVGNDDIASAGDTAPPLTTAVAPAAELGVRTIRMLEGLIAGAPPEAATVTLDTRLVVRRSCGCAGTGPDHT